MKNEEYDPRHLEVQDHRPGSKSPGVAAYERYLAAERRWLKDYYQRQKDTDWEKERYQTAVDGYLEDQTQPSRGASYLDQLRNWLISQRPHPLHPKPAMYYGK